MAGDKIDIGVKSFYKSGGTAGSPNSVLTDILTALANGLVSTTGGSKGAIGDLNNTSTSPLFGALQSFTTANNPTPSGKPKAYLNWILLDEQFKYVSSYPQSGAIQVGSADVLNTLAMSAIPITKSGYLYVWVSNETPAWDVFFDNLSVQHTTGPILEETHYYPFGLTIAAISSKALKTNYAENKYRFNEGTELQNQEFSDGTGIELYETTFRGYDPQIGRFGQIDPLSIQSVFNSPYDYCGNNPVNFTDALGLRYTSQAPSFQSLSELFDYIQTNGTNGFGDGLTQYMFEGGGGSVTNTIYDHNPTVGFDKNGNYGISYSGSYVVHNGSSQKFAHATLDELGIVKGFLKANTAWDRYSSYQNQEAFETGHEFLHWTEFTFTAGEVSNASRTFGSLGGKAYWIGKNLKVYSQTWGGNGFTGGRNAVQEFAEGMGKVAKPLGIITSAYSGYQAINDFSNGHTEAGLVHSADAVMGAIGTFCGPVGWAVSGAYFISRFWWGNEEGGSDE